ncbi:MAG: S8 family serine peptidase [Phycisphaerales bacterium]|nr:MAG: S8 family serine peptidase [Phycisphaerales bacterium]
MVSLRTPMSVVVLLFCSLSFAQPGPGQGNAPGRRVLIGFRAGAGPRTPDTRAAVVRNEGGQIHASFGLVPVVSAMLPEPAIANLQRRPDIAYVEDDIRVSIVQAPQTVSWGVDRIDADRVWSTNTGYGINVAILDTGIDYDHPDLQTNVQGGVYFAGWIIDELMGKDGSTIPADWDDGHGHGTHCAGIVAAANNTFGVAGVAPEANLWGVKVLDDNGGGYTSDIIQGIQWCADNGIEVGSMSFGASSGTASLQSACQAAFDAGVFLVAAAGNDYGGPVIYPAAYASVTAVSAVGQNADGNIYLADFSNVGPEIRLAAPGVSINSTFNGGGYKVWGGTSMACPHVAGAAALAWASGLSSPMGVQTRLWDTAEDMGPYGWDSSYGYGLVDAEAAAGGTAIADDPPTVTITGPADGATVFGTITLVAEAGDDNGVEQVEFFVEGQSIGLGTGGPDAWSTSWDTTAQSNGSYTISATATDTIGQTADHSVDVTVDNGGEPDDPPSITITYPANGAIVSGTITVRADADDDDLVTNVEFFVDGISIGLDTDDSDGWSTSWDTSAYTNGSYAVSATATDTVGQTASDSVDVTVDNAEALPTAHVTVNVSVLPYGRKWWFGMAEILVEAENGPLVGATLEGYWSGLSNQIVSETTDEFGFVGLLTRRLRKSGTVTFTVTGVARDGNQYILDPAEPADSIYGP